MSDLYILKPWCLFRCMKAHHPCIAASRMLGHLCVVDILINSLLLLHRLNFSSMHAQIITSSFDVRHACFNKST
jgi:hypothetical protein